MLDLTRYNLDDDDIEFVEDMKEDIENQNEIILAYQGKSFVLEPRGEAVHVYAYGEVLGYYENFDDLLLNHKIDGKPLIELVKDLDYGE